MTVFKQRSAGLGTHVLFSLPMGRKGSVYQTCQYQAHNQHCQCTPSPSRHTPTLPVKAIWGQTAKWPGSRSVASY